MTPDKQRIAKNTIYLYARMLLLMVVTLYTSRIVLKELGIVDYGVYNVVGGVVAMIGFINASLTSSTQRFLNVEMARGDLASLNHTFIQAVNAHIVIAIITVVILETIGVWFILHKLVIPANQLNNAIWVFQCSVLSFAITIISAPYNAAIIANERMSVFAGTSIMDAILRLVVAFAIGLFPSNRLKYYAILLLCVAIIMRFIYGVICIRLFKECRYRLLVKWKVMKQMFTFSGWMIFGCVSDMFAGQGVNILINMFFGPVFNAARGIAMQVQGAISQLSSNFIISVNPQIVKLYSSGEFKESFKLTFQSSKLSFFLMLILVVPLSIRINEILGWWLIDVPQLAGLFAQLILIEYLIRSSYTPIAQINVASGKVRDYQLSISILFLVTFVGSFVLFKFKFPVYSTFILSIIIAIIGLFVRLFILKRQSSFPMGLYLRTVTLPLILVFLCSIIISSGIDYICPINFGGTIITIISSLIVTGIFAWMIGLNKNEKLIIKSKVKSIIQNKFH